MRLEGTAGESACNQPLKAAWEVFKWERAGSAQRLHRPKADHSTAPALDEPGPDLPGLYWYSPMKEGCQRCVQTCPYPLQAQPR